MDDPKRNKNQCRGLERRGASKSRKRFSRYCTILELLYQHVLSISAMYSGWECLIVFLHSQNHSLKLLKADFRISALYKLILFVFNIGFSLTKGRLTGQKGKYRITFIPFCYFHPPMKIQTFICKFATEMNTAYF